MASLESLDPVLAQAEREVATLAESVAGLYDAPVTDARTQWLLQRRRAELDQRLAEARLRLLKIQLVMTDHEYVEVGAALQQEQQNLGAAEANLRRAQAHLAIARERHDSLEVRELSLRDRRRDLLRKLEAVRPVLDEAPEQPLGMSA